MKRYLHILLLGAVLIVSGCDFRYRTVDSGATPEEIQKFVDDLVPNISAMGDQVRDLYADPNTYLYFAQWENGYSPMGPLDAVAPIYWDLVTGDSNLTFDKIQGLRVYLFHKIYADNTSDDVLILEYLVNGSTTSQYKVYSNIGNDGQAGIVSDNIFNAVLIDENGSNSITLESYDVAGDDLDVDIQLRLYSGNSPDEYWGKFSNLEGFSI